MAKIGIYGGTFNPPHLGHRLAVCEFAAKLGLDRVLMVPAAQPPHKALPPGAPDPATRLRLCRLAAADLPFVEVSDLEQLKGGDVLCLIQEDKPISLGIDLMQDIGIRVVNGDKEQWQREFTGDEFPLYSFGISGCWVNDGHFSYVKEEDYTQDMLDALAERVNQVKRAAFHR